MRELRPKGIEINIDDKPRRLLFTLNAIDELQEEYELPIPEIIAKVFDTDAGKLEAYKHLKKIITILLNNDVEIHNEENPGDKWEFVTERYVGNRLTIDNIGIISEAMLIAFTRSFPKKHEDDDDDPNRKSGR